MPDVAGIRLLAAPPSRIGVPLREALRMAADACSLPVVDVVNFDAAHHVEAPELLVICADVSGIDIQQTRRLAVMLGDPDWAVGLARDGLAIDSANALLFSSRCYAQAVDAARAAGVTISSEAEVFANPVGVLASLLRDLDIHPEPPRVGEILGWFSQAVEALGSASHREDEAMAGALTMYRNIEAGRVCHAWWDRSLFKWGDQPHEVCPSSLDITGGARTLVFGPYVNLPAGPWRLTPMFDLCGDAARRFYRVAFGSRKDFSYLDLWPLKPGRNKPAIVHRFSSAGPAEFALVVPHAAFHGELRFLGAMIESADDIDDLSGAELAPDAVWLK